MFRRRSTILVVVLGILGTAAAQRPLNTPNYYLFELPELHLGESTVGELAPEDGQSFKDGAYVDLYTLTGEEGQQLSLRVASTVFDPYVTLYDAEGFVISMNDDYDGMLTDAGVSVELPAAGRYLVVVSGYSQFDLGSYTVTIDETSRLEPEARPVELPATLGSELRPDAMPALETWMGPTEYFTFDIDEPVVLVATMSSLEFDTVLTLLGHDWVQIAQNDDADFSSDSRLFAKLEPGRYVLAATSYFPDSYGSYELSLETYVRSE